MKCGFRESLRAFLERCGKLSELLFELLALDRGQSLGFPQGKEILRCFPVEAGDPAGEGWDKASGLVSRG